MDYKKATIILDVPIIKKEKGRIPLQFDVKGSINLIEDFICSHLAQGRKIEVAKKGKTRYEEALWMLHELKKYYLADCAEVKKLPIVK